MIPRTIALLVVSALVGVGCSSDSSGSADPTITNVATTAPATAASTAPSTTLDTTTTSTTVATTTTTTAPTTTVAPTTEPPTTIAPEDLPPLARLELGDGGIGSARLGDDPDDVIEFVGSILGSPTGDTGWVAAGPVALCPGDEFRQLEWGVLRVAFGDDSPYDAGRPHFIGWEYGIDGLLGEEPQGLITAEGVGLGTRLDELRAAYPGVEVFEGEEGLFPPTFSVSPELDGYLSGTAESDIVTVLFGGFQCGE